MNVFRGGITMSDVIEIIGKGSVIHHGKLSDRIYLMKLDDGDSEDILGMLAALAEKFKYSKLFCKIPKAMVPLFIANGFVVEAQIPKFYNTSNDVFFVSKFLDANRSLIVDKTPYIALNKLLLNSPKKKKLTTDYSIITLDKTHVEQITAIYRKVFKSYPFPIHEQDYILETMAANVLYFGAEKDGELVALASSEMDLNGKNAEMTDFATLPEHAGNNLALMLLSAMENEMKERGIHTLYTIARLNSIPMNVTFLRSNYSYTGTLINNTNIAGTIESMNVYYKHI